MATGYAPYSSAMLTALSQEYVSTIMAVEIEFKSGTSRAHSGLGNVVIDGQTFIGVGDLGEIGEANARNKVQESDITLSLSGMKPDIIGEVLNERCVGVAGRVILVALDPVTGAILAADTMFDGYVSKTAMVAGERNAISVTLSNVFEKWNKGLPDRYTDASHSRKYPGDRIFRYVAQMADRSIFWGSKQDAPAFRYEGD